MLPLWVRQIFWCPEGDNEDERISGLEQEICVQYLDWVTEILVERTGGVLDAAAVLAVRSGNDSARTEVPLRQFFDSTGKKPVGARWVHTDNADGATNLKPNRSVVDLGELYARHAACAEMGDVREMILVDCGKRVSRSREIGLISSICEKSFVEMDLARIQVHAVIRSNCEQ